MTIDDYIVLADIPKILLESEEESPGLRRRNQSPSPCRDQKLRTYRLVVPYIVLYGIDIPSQNPTTMHLFCSPKWQLED